MGPSSVELSRLRWQCRRGLLENDLILEKFLARHGEALDPQQFQAFQRLLTLGDNELWDILSGKVDYPTEADPATESLMKLLQAC